MSYIDQFGRFMLTSERRRVSPHYAKSKWGLVWTLADRCEPAEGVRSYHSQQPALHALRRLLTGS